MKKQRYIFHFGNEKRSGYFGIFRCLDYARQPSLGNRRSATEPRRLSEVETEVNQNNRNT